MSVNWKLTMVVAMVVVVFRAANSLVLPRLRVMSDRLVEVNQKLARHMLLTVDSIRLIRVFGQERWEAKRFEHASDEVRRSLFGVSSLAAMVGPGLGWNQPAGACHIPRAALPHATFSPRAGTGLPAWPGASPSVERPAPGWSWRRPSRPVLGCSGDGFALVEAPLWGLCVLGSSRASSEAHRKVVICTLLL